MFTEAGGGGEYGGGVEWVLEAEERGARGKNKRNTSPGSPHYNPSKAASITFRVSRTIAGSVWKWKSSSNSIALSLPASIPELPSARGVSDAALTKVLIRRWV